MQHLYRVVPQLATVTYLFGTFVTKARAQFTDPPPIPETVDDTDPEAIVLRIIEFILNIILIIAVLFVIIAGVRLIISSGNDEQKDAAKKTIIYVIAGIIVILFARAIVVFVKNAFNN